MLCGSLDGRRVWERMDTCISMVESLCCPPETITTLLIGYTSVQNKKFKKKDEDRTNHGIQQHVNSLTIMHETWSMEFSVMSAINIIFPASVGFIEHQLHQQPCSCLPATDGGKKLGLHEESQIQRAREPRDQGKQLGIPWGKQRKSETRKSEGGI